MDIQEQTTWALLELKESLILAVENDLEIMSEYTLTDIILELNRRALANQSK